MIRQLSGLIWSNPSTLVLARLYTAARPQVKFFQPSFKLKKKRREGAKIIKHYHSPAKPYERALANPTARTGA